jgi:hypothetical protein
LDAECLVAVSIRTQLMIEMRQPAQMAFPSLIQFRQEVG